jgi:hypothetical protein
MDASLRWHDVVGVEPGSCSLPTTLPPYPVAAPRGTA